ncbi:UDP-N-acetylglucosamine pyrophosphorylase [Clostridium omnivorum]|uniref:Glucose-1-phosphate thymidylyltransferase n=1 Tax=Clostridium omnivorum TaxID=1604902 RepID=A0ABQ5N4Q7_9CLOT|nr:UDP-N-acetylglucosamine pyrophosphorylase [Clostridium sp. E14]GLC30218.1 glucose-1-phosphate thymidylyltransferase [Clostridium sp. E14]
MNISVNQLLNIEELDARAIFEGVKYPWEALAKIKNFIFEYAKNLPDDFERIEEFVWVGKGTTIEKSVLIKGPAIIGYNCEIRHSAYIRDNVILGNNVVVGNSTEIKNSILFNKAQVPHYNYVGDSILGYKAHLGAGAITSNLKSDGTLVKVKCGTDIIETGLRKFGAILGDLSEVGCNSVLNPGTIIGKDSIVYPLSSVRGYIPENSILKNNGEIVERK